MGGIYQVRAGGGIFSRRIFALPTRFADALRRNDPLIEQFPEEIVAEIILHQYVNSPFSAKVRKIFAHKKVSWRSVEQPVIMPKPKLIPLTGGYRRVPGAQGGGACVGGWPHI